MEQQTLFDLKFGSFIKFSCLLFLSLGLVGGILSFLVGLFGGNISAYLGDVTLTGIPAGIVGLFLTPLFFLILGLISGLVAFFPFNFLLKGLKGLRLKGHLEAPLQESK